MKQLNITQLDSYVKNESKRRNRRRIIVGLSALVLLVTLIAVILPAYTLEKNELTEAEQTRVNEVIALIDAIPSASEIDTAIAEYASVYDYTGEETYVTETYTKVNEAYAAYSTLSESMRSAVTNSDKLMELEHIWSASTLAEEDDGNAGTIKKRLDGDYAYISSLKVTNYSTGGVAAPFDEVAGPGNDISATDKILRTFDTTTYTLAYQTKLRNEVQNDNIGGYLAGRVYYEFILPVTSEEAVFEVDQMSWMRTYPSAYYSPLEDTEDGEDAEVVEEYVTINGETKLTQIIRGSFLLSNDQKVMIGEGEQTLHVVVRAKSMSNGDKLQPIFTMWLEYNEVGAVYSTETTDANALHTNIVYGQDIECAKTDEGQNNTEQTTPHGKEAVTVVTDKIYISASPKYNIGIETGHAEINVSSGTYDFSTYSTWLDTYNCKDIFGEIPNQNAGIHTGRMVCFGLEISLYDPVKGLVGMQLPDEESAITFQIDLSTFVKAANGDDFVDVTATHAPLVWSAGGNYQAWDQRGFNIDSWTCAFNTPINSPGNPLNLVTYEPGAGTCNNGGNWIFKYDPDYPTTVFVEVSNFEINLEKLPSIQGNSGQKLHDAEAIGEEYWKITNGIFSTGKIYVLQPFTPTAEGAKDVRDEYGDGNSKLVAKIDDMYIKCTGDDDRGPGEYKVESTMNMNDVDDEDDFTSTFLRPGHIDSQVAYLKENGVSPWSSGCLTDGCSGTNLDWAFPGQTIRLWQMVQQMGAEGNERVIGSDVLLKFDDAFFEPTEVWLNSNSNKDGKKYGLFRWAAKPDGKGWDHQGLAPDDEGYDLEMRQATPEDLVYYRSLDELKEAGAVCVGVLALRRDVFWVNTQMQFMVEGTIKKTAEPGQVYLLTYFSCAWRIKQFSEDARIYFGLDSVNDLTDDQYCKYAQNAHALPEWWTQTLDNWNAGYRVKYEDYKRAFYIESYDYATQDGNKVSRHQKAKKASYDANGVHDAGSNSLYEIDCCLVAPYVTTIDKGVAQTITVNGETKSKTEYELSENQKTVDYVLTPSAQRSWGAVEATEGAELTTTVYIEDIIPKELTVLFETIRWEGQYGTIEYVQDSKFQNPGSVTGGLEAGEKNEQGQYFTVEVTTNANGETVIRLTFHNVVIDGNELTNIGKIYYSCVIDEEVENATILSNTAKIWSVEDRRNWIASNQNISTAEIRVSKLSAMSLSKLSDWLVAELWEDHPFTMQVNNNSAEAWANEAIIVETLPFNGIDRSAFNGRLLVSAFSADLKNNDGLNGFVFYYTTDRSYAGIRAEQLTDADFSDTAVWKPLSMSETGVAALPSADEQKGWGTYSDGSFTQITAIVAIGKLPSSDTLEMKITLDLPDGKANDLLINYLSQDNGLETYARTQIVDRSLEGLTWIDQNQNGVQDEEAIKNISGVKVSLLKLNTQTNEYEPYCYPNTAVPVVIQSGQKVSVLDQTTVSEYERGRYQFTDLPAGTFAVLFESGDETTGGFDIAPYTASAVNAGSDDQIDSDGVPAYNDSETALLKTQINGIEMKPARSLTYGRVESKYHDSGFYYTTYELPVTGGMGTTPIYVLGGLLIVVALGGYMLIKRKQNKF